MVNPTLDPRIRRIIIVSIFLSPIFISILSLFIGAYHLSPDVVIGLITSEVFSHHIGSVEHTILFDIRIPRIILAFIVGAALSLSGACFQGTFRNPLVSEYILGVSTGAAFGASLSIALFGKSIPIQLLAFIGGISAVAITYLIATRRNETPVLSLVLAGIVTTAVFTAGNYLIRYFVEPEKLHTIIIWIMGSFSGACWEDIIYSFPLIFAGSIVLLLLRWRINLLSMGDEEAKALGMEVKKTKLIIMGVSTLITSMAICTVGIIGWVGLIIPHIVRMLLGSDNRIVLPLSTSLGATVMLCADNIVRMAPGVELPVGVLTTLIGAPFFAYLIRKSKGGAWE